MLAFDCESESVLKLTILHNLKKMQRLVRIYFRIRHTAASIIQEAWDVYKMPEYVCKAIKTIQRFFKQKMKKRNQLRQVLLTKIRTRQGRTSFENSRYLKEMTGI
jgi:hypothetical protein